MCDTYEKQKLQKMEKLLAIKTTKTKEKKLI